MNPSDTRRRAMLPIASPREMTNERGSAFASFARSASAPTRAATMSRTIDCLRRVSCCSTCATSASSAMGRPSATTATIARITTRMNTSGPVVERDRAEGVQILGDAATHERPQGSHQPVRFVADREADAAITDVESEIAQRSGTTCGYRRLPDRDRDPRIEERHPRQPPGSGDDLDDLEAALLGDPLRVVEAPARDRGGQERRPRVLDGRDADAPVDAVRVDGRTRDGLELCRVTGGDLVSGRRVTGEVLERRLPRLGRR